MNTYQTTSHRLLPARLMLAIVFYAVLASAFGQPAPAAAQVPAEFSLVADVSDTPYPSSSLSSGGANSFQGAFVNGTNAFFVAYRPDTGEEIWRSDGTEAGTILLKDICPGDGSQRFQQFAAIGSTIFFMADDCASGRELWKTDGTPAGTQLVKDIYPGPYGSQPEHFFVAGDKLFFTAYDGTATRIWRSNGTEAGTSSTGYIGEPIFVLGNGMFFTTYDASVCKIKRMDAASNVVTDLTTMCPRGVYPNGSGVSIAAGAALAYYTAGDSSTGTEVWRTDGTPAGTSLLLDIRPGGTGSNPSNFVVNSLNQLIFAANDGVNGEELWKSDGATVTSLIKDINPGAGSSGPSNITLWNGGIYFTAYDGAQVELWRSNGFGSQTYVVKDLTPAGGSSNVHFLTAAANGLYFVASEDTHKNALFKTDGTSSGTVLVKDLNSSDVSYNETYNPTAFGGGVVFLGDDGEHGGEPWFSDGTEAGTRVIKDIAGPETYDTLPIFTRPFNEQVLYFGRNFANISANEYNGLYRSDGTAGGTTTLNTFSLAPESEYNHDQAPALFNGALYFAARKGNENGTELWRSDGTSAGTTMFLDMYPGENSGNPRWLAVSGQTMFFRANNGTNGDELWKTGGTPETTSLVKDIFPDGDGSYPEYITPDGADGVYFAAYGTALGSELWRSDGTAGGTRMLLDIHSGNNSSSPENLTLVGTNLFFSAKDATNGRELWVTNGTPEGTRRVRDISPGNADTYFEPNRQPFAVLGNRVFFAADTDLFGAELWSSDGTENGTAIVKDVYPGANASNIQDMTVMNGALYFSATGDDGKRTLWRSDGTTVGTQRVTNGVDAPVNPEAFSVIDGLLYFSAADRAAAAGRELWVSDGAAGGTRMLQDLNPGPTSSNPRGIVMSDQRFYLSAYKPGAGVELWSAQMPQPPNPTPQRLVYLPLANR